MEYFTLTEVANKYNVSRSSLKGHCQRGKFPNAKQVKNKSNILIWCLSTDDLMIIQEELDYIEKSYSRSEIIKLLNCGLNHVDILINKGKFKNYRIINKTLYINKEEIDVYRETQKFNIDNYYELNEVSEILGVSRSTASQYIKRNQVKNHYVYKNRQYILKDEIDRAGYILDSHYTTNEISKKLKMNLATISKKCQEGDFEGTIKNPINSSLWLVPKEVIDNMLITYIDKKTVTSNPYELFIELTKGMEKGICPNTYKLYESHIREFINKTNSKKVNEVVKNMIAQFKILDSILIKEIYDYTDFEIELLLKDGEQSVSYGKTIIEFLSYLKKKKDVACVFKREYVFNKKDKKSNSCADNIYSKEIWKEYYLHLTDIDKHIEKAIEDKNYASTWLYLLMHLVLAWRRSDIVKLPNIYLEEINIYNFEWFYNNKFSLSMGEKVINYVRNRSETIYTDKTGVRTHFVMTLDMIIPSAIAFVIAEIHRRNNGFESILSQCTQTKMHKDRQIKNVLYNKEELYDFSSLKANRTLLTYSYENAVGKEGMAYMAYELGESMRSHKKSKNEIATSTEKYIYSTNEDGSIEDITFNLFRRGFWGWLYKDLLYICNEGNTKAKYSLAEETNEIVALTHVFNPSEVESISKFIKGQVNKKDSVIQELLLLPKGSIKELVKKLINKELPSKMENSQCIKSGTCNNLVSETCLGCKYLIPEYCLLYTLKDELYSMIEKLKNVPQKKKYERIKYTNFIYKMLYLLQEAKREYDKYDENYINSIFDLGKLHENIEYLNNNNFMDTNEGDN